MDTGEDFTNGMGQVFPKLKAIIVEWEYETAAHILEMACADHMYKVHGGYSDKKARQNLY